MGHQITKLQYKGKWVLIIYSLLQRFGILYYDMYVPFNLKFFIGDKHKTLGKIK